MSGRAFATHELAARAWWHLSSFKSERGLAARRFRDTAPACADDDLRLQIFATMAAQGFHAYAITERVVRDRASRIADAYPDEALAARVLLVLRTTAHGMSLRRVGAA